MNKNLIEHIKEHVNMLLSSLENHYYHEYSHALDVANRCLEIWEKEWVSEDEKEMLVIAALFHDTWFIVQYDDNEHIWATIAKNFLRWTLYPEEKIKIIEDLIIATIYENKNNVVYNKLQKIIRDADTDNLWRDDFFEKWEKLKREIESIKKIKILYPDWYHYSLKFLHNHKFETKTEIEERQSKKEENKKILENKINKND